MAMTDLEIKQNALKAQAEWGPYGFKETDDVSTILYKLSIQIETLMRSQKRVTEATQDHAMMMDVFAKGLAAVESGLENKAKIFTDSRGSVKII